MRQPCPATKRKSVAVKSAGLVTPVSVMLPAPATEGEGSGVAVGLDDAAAGGRRIRDAEAEGLRRREARPVLRLDGDGGDAGSGRGGDAEDMRRGVEGDAGRQGGGRRPGQR